MPALLSAVRFIVDPEGVIQVELVTAGGIGRNAENFSAFSGCTVCREHGDQVTPAKWRPG